MKTFKLWIHPKKDEFDHELVINPKDFPGVKLGDVVEIYFPENEYSRLLLQVSVLKENLIQKETVGVARPIANIFNMTSMYKDVCVNVVDPQTVALDLVELVYKDQYFSRADMWRLRKSLVKHVMYRKKNVKFAEMSAHVNELWSKGEIVTSGYVTSDTRVTFRSSTAQVNIFIQMSSEMWEFDNYGDLYFEKAVAFLVELFSQWKDMNCNHDVTITLFSRTFYDAQLLEEFPMHMRECVQRDYLGRFYEDFYRVVVQNERYDEWTKTLIELKRLFNQYPQRVLHYHERLGIKVPHAYNSAAAQGNFLEVLNMGLNVFEKYFLDRCLDRTGKLSIVITPGAGVFEVDRELTNITKQRTIDCGNGSDLVCMGEQPLHAVPLFKFHNKNPSTSLDVGDDYNIPHWMNHSFYTSRRQAEHANLGRFVPRIKIQETISDMHGGRRQSKCPVQSKWNELQPPSTSTDSSFPFVDYDDYDAQIFKLPANRIQTSSSDLLEAKKTSCSYCNIRERQYRIPRVRYISDVTDLISMNVCEERVSGSIDIQHCHDCEDNEEFMSNSFGGRSSISSDHDSEDHIFQRVVVGSAGAPDGHHSVSHPALQHFRPHRALINPFAPTRLHFKVTSNRRRWAHAFPTDLSGASIQTHHQVSAVLPSESLEEALSGSRHSQGSQLAVEFPRHRIHKSSESSDGADQVGRIKTASTGSGSSDSSLKEPSVTFGKALHQVSSSGALSISTAGSSSSISSVINTQENAASSSGGRFRPGSSWGGMYSRSSSFHRELGQIGKSEDGHYWLWGITGEQEWTPDTTTGMDWKSMTMPASLPLTTDYFPDKRSLQVDYVISDYSLLPEDLNSDKRTAAGGRKPLTSVQVYKEMIAQRVAQGFQIVLRPKPSSTHDAALLSSSPCQGASALLRARSKIETVEEHILSIGRIFHKISLCGKTITVTRYWPAHPYPQKSFHYPYRFQVPDSDRYDVSWSNFTNEKLEHYNWNYVDLYLITRGEEDFGLMESLKYWRARFILLPCNNPATRKVMDGADRCDIYEPRLLCDQQHLIQGFLKWVETMNKIKARRQVQNRQKGGLTRRSSLTTSPGGFIAQQVEKEKSEMREATPGKMKVNIVKGKVTEGVESSPISIVSSPGVSGMEFKKGMVFQGNSDVASVTMSYAPAPQQQQAKPAENLQVGDKSDRKELSMTTALAEIAEAMMDANDGLCFLNKQQGLLSLPSFTFVSAEAVQWMRGNVEGAGTVAEAMQLLQGMVQEKLICHASGNPRHSFIYGFYLYSFVTLNDKGKDKEALYPSEFYYNTSFQYEWCEVAAHSNDSLPGESGPAFLSENLMIPIRPRPTTATGSYSSPADWRDDHQWGGRANQVKFIVGSGGRRSGTPDLTVDLSMLSGPEPASPLYKLVNVDIDPNSKSDREEWGTARYHGNYNPNFAFELELEWLVATGSILMDLVNVWQRKASQCCFHFLPVPGDPFGLPFNANSDPLRGPIFIPLHLEHLTIHGYDLFEDFPPDTREERLLLFQESILHRFGFLRDRCSPPGGSTHNYGEESQPVYVHCTGGMLVLLPDNKTTSPRNVDGTHRKPVVGSYKDYIMWQRRRSDSFTRTRPQQQEDDHKVGFLWAWNFMLTKKWRTSNTGDEHFQDKMLADFRRFCANEDNRLKDYWEMCRFQGHTEDAITIVASDEKTSEEHLEEN